jgi:hypothetical protein
MREYYRIKIDDWGVDILVAVKNDRIVDPNAVERIEQIFPDYRHRFVGKPFSSFKQFLLDQYRTKNVTVFREKSAPGKYA